MMCIHDFLKITSEIFANMVNTNNNLMKIILDLLYNPINKSNFITASKTLKLSFDVQFKSIKILCNQMLLIQGKQEEHTIRSVIKIACIYE